MKWRKRLYEIIEKSEKGDTASRTFDIFIVTLILLNVLSIILESFSDFETRFISGLYYFELFSIVIFTIEYIFRLLTSDLKFPSKNIAVSIIKYIFSFMAIIDLIAILPFYLPAFIDLDFRFVRIIRLIRILRLLKIGRYSDSLQILGSVLKRKKEELIVTIFVTGMLLLLASSCMFYVEAEAQPDSFPNIIAAFWWGVATLTTVGYGDVYPVTVLGKVISGIVALLGIGIVAMPAGIISAGFLEVLQEKNVQESAKEKSFCPYCGEKIIE